MDQGMTVLKSPYPYFGGKSRIAGEVWKRFGIAGNYVEPFFGSGAVLLARTDDPGIETINDLDGFIVNFWRSVKYAPEEILYWADYPLSEMDLRARHGWLVNRAERLVWCLEDPDFYDPKIAAWWVWGLSQWIGGGFCSGRGPYLSNGAQFFRNFPKHQTGFGFRIPAVSGSGSGIHRKSLRNQFAVYIQILSARLRHVRILCGDWARVVKPSVTIRRGLTAVFLDPPYDQKIGRCKKLYNHETDVSHPVREWAIDNGDNPLFRIALCGYEGEHKMPKTWECVAWKATGGYGNQRRNRTNPNRFRERIWFSPHCLKVKQVRKS